MSLLHWRAAACLLPLLTFGRSALAVDWPMWRFDASRSASSPEELPANLHLQWTLDLPKPEPCWPYTQYKLQFDKSYEPVAAGGLLFVPSMVRDSVTAFDVETGEKRWRFYAGGPVRFAPLVWERKLYFASDDSYLYCLDAATGKLLWKFRGAPSERKLLGNARFVSAWPARGAPVVYDGTVYFAASIWPFMGTFFYALDAETGKLVWSNSGSGQDYMLQPHSSPAFAGVAPQGYLIATEEELLVPGGRSVPAAYDRETGAFLYHHAVTKNGGYAVYHRGDVFLNDGYVHRSADGVRLGRAAATVLSPDVMLGIPGDSVVRARSLRAHVRETVDKKGKKQKVTDFPVIWEAKSDPGFERAYMRAGSRLYCGAPGLVGAIDLPATPDAKPGSAAHTEAGNESNDPPALIARGARWQYLAGSHPEGNWTQVDFDASGWKTGPAGFGYGDDDDTTVLGDMQGKYTTVYVRHRFDLPKDALPKDLGLFIDYDDAFIAYLNGQEVLRRGVGEGAGPEVTGVGGHEAAGAEYFPLTESLELLHEGANVLCVEGHNRSAQSSDFSLHPALLLGKPSVAETQPQPTTSPSLRVSWQSEIGGDVWTMLAANGRLFVVTETGRLYCFGGEATQPKALTVDTDRPLDTSSAAERARQILDTTDVRDGYCLVLGLGTGALAHELVRQSDLHVVGLDPDASKVDALRRQFDDAGVYGKRLSLVVGDPLSVPLPPLFASLVVSEDLAAAGFAKGDDFTKRVFEVLRPYGGVACLSVSGRERTAFATAATALDLPNAVFRTAGDFSLLERQGALPGAAPWTHQYGDVANSVCSKDQIAKSPLGMLWFGGPGHIDVLPRHGHGPSEQVIGGRLFIEGIHTFSARDVYTGRVLWRKDLPNLNTYDMYYDVTYRPNIYDRTYNQVHIPGANQYGSNFVATEDRLYLVQGTGTLLTVGDLLAPTSFLLKLRSGDDPVSKHLRERLSESVLKAIEAYDASIPPTSQLQNSVVTDLNRLLRAEALYDPERFEGVALSDVARAQAARQPKGDALLLLNRSLLEAAYPNEIAKRLPRPVCLVLDPVTGKTLDEFHLPAKPGIGTPNWGYLGVYEDLLLVGAVPYHLTKSGDGAALALNNRFAVGSRYLVAMNRQTGEVLWEREAAYNFRHNTIAAGDGKVFCLDSLSKTRMALLERRGQVPESKPQVLALDIRTGEELWSEEPKFPGTWLSYSEEYGVVVLGGSAAGDRARDEQRSGMSAYKGTDGSLLWHLDDSYAGPPILYHDRILTQAGGGNTEAAPAKAYSLLTGKRVTTVHPITGETVPWGWVRFKGCNTALASEHLLTFRSASGCYADLPAGHNTTSIGGFKSGCTSNLVVADGVLNAPDYTRTCTCSYQNQTSFALAHMPDAFTNDLGIESWSFDYLPAPEKPTPVKRVGLNFGAPGNRLAEDGTLWLEWPSVGGPSPEIAVYVHGQQPKLFRTHMSEVKAVDEGALPWVAASGIEGVTGVAIRPFVQPTGPGVDAAVQGFTRHMGTNALLTSFDGAQGEFETARPYTLRLHFAEREGVKPGERVFSVSINGKRVAQSVDIAKEAGATGRALVREFKGVSVTDDLRIGLTPSDSATLAPLLCGVEIIAEDAP